MTLAYCDGVASEAEKVKRYTTEDYYNWLAAKVKLKRKKN